MTKNIKDGSSISQPLLVAGRDIWNRDGKWTKTKWSTPHGEASIVGYRRRVLHHAYPGRFAGIHLQITFDPESGEFRVEGQCNNPESPEHWLNHASKHGGRAAAHRAASAYVRRALRFLRPFLDAPFTVNLDQVEALLFRYAGTWQRGPDAPALERAWAQLLQARTMLQSDLEYDPQFLYDALAAVNAYVPQPDTAAEEAARLRGVMAVLPFHGDGKSPATAYKVPMDPREAGSYPGKWVARAREAHGCLLRFHLPLRNYTRPSQENGILAEVHWSPDGDFVVEASCTHPNGIPVCPSIRRCHAGYADAVAEVEAYVEDALHELRPWILQPLAPSRAQCAAMLLQYIQHGSCQAVPIGEEPLLTADDEVAAEILAWVLRSSDEVVQGELATRLYDALAHVDWIVPDEPEDARDIARLRDLQEIQE